MQTTSSGATQEGTQRYCDRAIAAGRHPSGYGPLGRTGLVVSGVGFGGYRIHEAIDEHRDALLAALSGGCNLIDTSTNYTDGASERLVGEAVRQAAVEVGRDALVVVSKAGYVQGSNLREARRRELIGDPYPEVVRYADGCWHCIHPAYLRDQLQRSLTRTGLERIDVYLLHNPEYYLVDRERADPETPLEQRREDFYGRIGRAFEYLETEVAAGRLGWYGVSSNTLGAPVGNADSVSVARLLRTARAHVGPGHHLAVLQLPLNLVELGGALGAPSALDEARQAEAGVLANRPLNALYEGRLLRLADFELGRVGRLERIERAVSRLEDEFAEGLGQAIELEDGGPTGQLFRYAQVVARRASELQDAVLYEEFVDGVLAPQVTQRVNRVDQALSGPMKVAWKFWLERYAEALTRQIEAHRAWCARFSQKRSEGLARAIDPLLPESWRDESLSRKAVASIRGLDAVSAVLVGMRREEYVSDTLGVLDAPRFEVAAADLTSAVAKGLA